MENRTKRIVGLKELAKMYALGKSTIYASVQDGTIPVVSIGGRAIKPYRVDLDVVEQLFASVSLSHQRRESRSLKIEESSANGPTKMESLWRK